MPGRTKAFERKEGGISCNSFQITCSKIKLVNTQRLYVHFYFAEEHGFESIKKCGEGSKLATDTGRKDKQLCD